VDRESFARYAQATREVHSIDYADRLACELLIAEGAPPREVLLELMALRLSQRIARTVQENPEISVSDLARLVSAAASLRRATSEAEKRRTQESDQKSSGESPEEELEHVTQEIYGLVPAPRPTATTESTRSGPSLPLGPGRPDTLK
jgi:hypothetical protein